jgi:hypothetical protein
MASEIDDHILASLELRLRDSFPWLFEILKELFTEYGGEDDQGSIKVDLNPQLGEAYASCIIHAPIRQSLDNIPIPEAYKCVLRNFNGAKLYALNLFGILEDESNHRTCLSLAAANQFWVHGYRRLPQYAFHFGSRMYTYSENLGYFLNGETEVFGALKSGGVIKRWPSIGEMLRDELAAAKEMETERMNRRSK